MEIFSMGERSNGKHKFGELKVCKTDKVREYFINPKTENETFDQGTNLVLISEKCHASLVKIQGQK